MITHNFDENTWVEIENGCPTFFSKLDAPIVLDKEDVEKLMELIKKSIEGK